MSKSKSNRKLTPKSLTHGRPPLVVKPSKSLPSKTTRTIIREHHRLLKQKAQAEKNGIPEQVSELERRIAANGGLEVYQLASQNGQHSSRGGDTSKQLIHWLEELCVLPLAHGQLRALEIGSLSPTNVISQQMNVQMTRIDLKSTHPDILEQNFMQRPLPQTDMDRFHLVSCSLVVNFVPDPEERGEMLKRTAQFLLSPASNSIDAQVPPLLFLTLPLPCVENSRYLTIDHLAYIMDLIGFEKVREKTSTKIYYSLWQLSHLPRQPTLVKKKEIRSGKYRNNFCIVLAHSKG